MNVRDKTVAQNIKLGCWMCSCTLEAQSAMVSALSISLVSSETSQTLPVLLCPRCHEELNADDER